MLLKIKKKKKKKKSFGMIKTSFKIDKRTAGMLDGN